MQRPSTVASRCLAGVRRISRTFVVLTGVACGPVGSVGSLGATQDSGSGLQTSGSSSGSAGPSSSGGTSPDAAGLPISSSLDGGSSAGSSAEDADARPTAMPGVCADMAAISGTITQQFGAAEIGAGATKTYFLQSNWWQTYASETEEYTGLSFIVHNPRGASVSASNGAPMGFPSLFIGQYAGNATTGSNLPKQVSALTSVPTIYKTNNSSIGLSEHNAAYDVWFTANDTPLSPSEGNPGAGGAYLMVWMFKPTDRQPRGSDSGHTGQTVAGVSGTWNVWVDSTNPPCISYVSTAPLDGLEFDLNDFIKDAVAKSYGLTSSMYLSIVFGGFEIWGGADGIQLSKFCVSVN